MNNRLSKIIQEYKKELGFIIFLASLNIIACNLDYFFLPINLRPANIFSYLIIGNANVIFCAVLTATYLRIIFVNKKLNFTAKFLLLFINIITWILDIFTFHYYQCRFDSGMLYTILASNKSEAKEFISAYLFQTKFLMFIVLILACLFILIFILKGLSRNKIFWCFVIAIAPLSGINDFYRGFFFRNFFSLFRLPIMTLETYHETKLFERTFNQAQKSVTLTKNQSTIPNVVFILGESTARKRMQIYGYPLANTPKLSQRKNIYVFDNITSPHASTQLVMEKLFTFYRLGEKNLWFTYQSLFNILREAGYRTIWLSNQEPYGVWGRAGRLYSSQADENKFTMIRSSRTELGSEIQSYDEKLLPLLDDSITRETNKNFYVLHLMGTHVNYAARYPKNFEIFTPEDEQGLSKIENLSYIERKIRASYDNAILYNDFVVDEIIKRFENKNAVIIFISDHGQEVFDNILFMGHHDKDNRTNSMFEIPFIIWVSDKFKNNYPDLCSRIENSINKSYITDNIIHMILDLMSIETPDYDPSKSLINEKFVMIK